MESAIVVQLIQHGTEIHVFVYQAITSSMEFAVSALAILYGAD